MPDLQPLPGGIRTHVHPDKHIGRRSMRLPADPVRVLQDAMAAILGRSVAV